MNSKSRFKLTDEVLETLCSLSYLHSLGLSLCPLTAKAGCAVAKAISPRLRNPILHLDHEGDPICEEQFMNQLGPILAVATALTSLDMPRSPPHECAAGALMPALNELTRLTKLQFTMISIAEGLECCFQPESFLSLAHAVQQMLHMRQLVLPLLSACDRVSMEALMSAVAKCAHLEALEILACTNIKATNAIAPVLQSVSQLRCLRVEHCIFVDAPTHGPHLCNVLGTLKQLEALVLKECWIPDIFTVSLQEAVLALRMLHSLDIKCPLDDSNSLYSPYLARSMHRLTAIVSLNIESSTVRMDSLVALLPQLRCLQLLFLTLSNHQTVYDGVYGVVEEYEEFATV